MDSEKGSGNRSRSGSRSTPSLVFLLLLASCLTSIAPVGSQRTVSSDMSNLHSTDPPRREPNLLQETAIKPPTLLEKSKPKHNKLKHSRHERKPSLNASLSLLKRRPLSPPSCLKATSINTAFKYINTVLSCVIFAVGIIGNATLLRIIYQNKSMRNGPNALIASLAFGDLIYIAIDVPINVYKKTSVGITVLNLCALSVDRYRAVASWSRVQGTGVPMVTAVGIGGIWLLSALLAVPEAVGFTMVTFEYRNATIRTCMLQPNTPFMTSERHSELTRGQLTCHQRPDFYRDAKDWWLFWVLLLRSSDLLGRVLRTHDLRDAAAPEGKPEDRPERTPQNREVAKAVFCLVLIFALCWFPLHLSRLLKRSAYRSHDAHRCELL
ncbi:hypothetical protein KUCAC02_013311, partial [Chaenocephalus aceratus]